MAESLMLWWHEAGLHGVTSAVPFRWRDAGKPVVAPEPSYTEQISAPGAQPSPPPLRLVQPASPTLPAGQMPRDLATFRAWLGEDAGQPDANWMGPLCLPSALIGAKLLVLTDMPGDGIEDPALPFDPAQARFLGAMLAAIGLRSEDVAFAPLAIRRPPGGLIDDETAATLAARMRHYLALSRPKTALILGDRTNRAMNTTQATQATGYLGEIHLPDGSLKVAALASPDHLMRRPTAKAKSWQTLRLLQGVIAE